MSEKKKSLSVSELNKVLPVATAERFKITDKIGNRSTTRCVFAKYGLIDLTKLSVARAEQLVKMGAPFIEVKPKATPSEKADGKPKTA